MSGDARDFNKIETRAVIKFIFLQGKAPKEIHAILTETSACFLPGRAKDLSAPLYLSSSVECPGGGHRVAPNYQDTVTTDAAFYTRRIDSSASSLREQQNSNTRDSYCGIMHSYLKVPHRPLSFENSAYKHVVAGNFLHYFFLK